MKQVWATVTASPVPLDESGRVYTCAVLLDEKPVSEQALPEGNATVFADLTPVPALGARVLLNTTAVELGLGTGGAHFVIAVVAPGEEPCGVALDEPAPCGGHLMKLRYTPFQRDVLAVESPESPHHATMQRVTDLDHVPVVCCGLHSQVPLVAAAIKARAPHLRVGYVMTDQAALSLGFSRVVSSAKDAGLIDITVSTGQAFGGDYEAINLHSGLLAACHVAGCDVIITGIGPGVAGTATPLGHGGVAQGEAINAVASLEGLPIACLRMSFADERERHRGISHHTLEALGRIALGKALIVMPYLEDEQQRAITAEQLDQLCSHVEHEGIEMEEAVFDETALKGVSVTTMGRGPQQDPAFFEAAFAAGAVAALMACEPDSSQE